MRFWRLARRHHAALDGEGARRYGGRWNRRGQAVVYGAQNLSLATLEIIVHLEVAIEDFPSDYVKIAFEVPDALLSRRIKTLPQTDEQMRTTGSRWYESADHVALLVPSVVIPEEFNVLLNPAHRNFVQVRVTAPAPFRIDPRLMTHLA